MDYSKLISAAPEMTLLGLICAVLIADLFVEDEHRGVTFWLSIAALFITGVALYATTPDARIVLFDGSYVSDPLSQVLKLGTVIFVAIVDASSFALFVIVDVLVIDYISAVK